MSKCVVIAEAGLNHLGKLELAKKLAVTAEWAHADIVKFQTYIPEKILRPLDPAFEVLSELALSRNEFRDLAKHCTSIGIEFMSTPGDVDSLKFLVEELGVKRIKIGSDDLTNEKLLIAAGDTKLPLIISTGMADMREIGKAWSAALPLGESVVGKDITLLHCVSLYPTPMKYANLGAITHLKNEFDHLAKIGYSDHTKKITAILIARALGAEMIEAHIKLSDTTPIDDAVSFSPDKFDDMVSGLHQVEIMLGDGVKAPSDAEKAVIPMLRKGKDGLRGAYEQMELPV